MSREEAAGTGGYIHLPGESEVRWMGETSTHFLATGEQTAEFCLIDERGHRGDSVPLHKHDEDMESFYVLEGEVTLFVGDGPGVTGPAGTFAHVPGGTVHGFRVESETARFLVLNTPSGHERWFRAAGEPAGSLELPAEPHDPEKAAAASEAFGYTVVGPFPDEPAPAG